ALAARARLRGRPLRHTIAALAAAAERWRADASLRADLPRAARLSPAMIAAVVPIAAEALDAATMSALAEREWGAGAAARPAPPGPALVAHVVASNVPALALPAIALGCLAGAAVLVKSGRDDPLSAPAFQRALAARLPPGPASVDARAAARLVAAEAEWAPGAAVLGGAGGTVIYEDVPAFRPTAGRRTVRVHPLRDVRELPELLPPGRIECLG